MPRVAKPKLPNLETAFLLIKTITDAFSGGAKSGAPRRADASLQSLRRRKGSDGANSSHFDVVSAKLCDDTINYLAPTLEQHKGCTIIDVHPGACLWSSKLHDFLRPKRHLLMEPEKAYYEPFIKPLLDKPGSTYRHTFLTGAHPRSYWDSYRTIMSDPALMPPLPKLVIDDPKRRQLQPDLLVIGSLARRYRTKRYGSMVSYAGLILQQLTYASLANDLFHRGGLVRMLWWIPESEKGLMFPPSQLERSAFNVGLNIGASINEVVGTECVQDMHLRSARDHRVRPAIYETAIKRRVDSSMQSLGMSIPEGREVLSVVNGEDCERTVSPLVPASTTVGQLKAEIKSTSAWLRELESVRHSFDARRITSPNTANNVAKEKLSSQLEFPQCWPIAKAFKSARSLDPLPLALAADAALRIIRLEVGFKELETTSVSANEMEKLRKQILALDDAYKLWFRKLPHLTQVVSPAIIEEQISLFLSPSLLAQEGRAYEPLKARAEEFFPKYEMTLLDLVPRSRDLSVPDIANNAEGTKLVMMLLKTMFESKKLTLPEALDRMAPNAAQDLIPMVPAITDPRRGGRLDPNNIVTRMLTEEMVEGIVKAWFEWPFRPSTVELELASDSSGSAEESVEDANAVLER